MNIVTTRKIMLWAVVLATCQSAVGLNAKPGNPSTFAGNFTLPYEVRWGKAVLPAGAYSINMDSIQEPAIVYSASGKTNIFVFPTIVVNSEKDVPCLTVLLRGNGRRVQSLNLPVLGKSFIYEPLTKAERELLVQTGQIQTIRITAASATLNKMDR